MNAFSRLFCAILFACIPELNSLHAAAATLAGEHLSPHASDLRLIYSGIAYTFRQLRYVRRAG